MTERKFTPPTEFPAQKIDGRGYAEYCLPNGEWAWIGECGQ